MSFKNTLDVQPHIQTLITKIWAQTKTKVRMPKINYNQEAQTTWLRKREFGPLWENFIIELTNMLEGTTLSLSESRNSCTVRQQVVGKSVRDMTPSEEQTYYNDWYRNASLWQTRDLLKRELTVDIYVDTSLGTLTIKEDESVLRDIVEWIEANPSMQGHYLCTQMITSYEIVDLEPRDQWFTRDNNRTYTDQYQQKALVMEVNHMPVCGKGEVAIWASSGEEIIIRTDFPLSFKESSKMELELDNKRACGNMLRWRLNQEEFYCPSFVPTADWEIVLGYEAALGTNGEIKKPQCLVPSAFFDSQDREELGGIHKSIFKNL